MPLVLLLLLVPLMVILLTPWLLLQRYRAGKARRTARPWVATLNVAVMVFSAAFFIMSAAVTTIWIATTFTWSLAGLGIGALLGLLSAAVARWDVSGDSLHYTPNRLLVLLVTSIVAARVAYGLYRSALAALAGLSSSAVVDAFGVPESYAAGGVVIGYYLAFNAGVRMRIRAQRTPPPR